MVKISYLTLKNSNVETMLLSHREYFEELEAGESYESDGIPKYSDDTEYIGLSKGELRWMCVHVSNVDTPYILRTQFMQNGEGWMSHIKVADGSEEIIHTNSLPGGYSHIIKSTKPAGKEWMVITNSLLGPEDSSKDLVQLDSYYDVSGACPADEEGAFSNIGVLMCECTKK